VLDAFADDLVFLTGISYASVGVYLLRKAAATGGQPERFLGLAFLANGISYAFTELPFIAGVDALIDSFSFVGRIWAGGCALTIALFTWRVFRRDSGWARRLVWLDAALVVCGLAISAVERDWEGMAPLTYKGFWLEWTGGVGPFVWLAYEALAQHLMTRRRIPLGLIDPLVCNRYLLIGLYGVLATTTFLILIPMYVIYETGGGFPAWASLALGFVELVSLGALYVSFAAPRWYCRWIGGELPMASG